MKGLLLSLVSFTFLLVISGVSLRAYCGKKYYYVFLVTFPIACLFYSLLFYGLPADLNFLPPHLLEPSRVVDFGFGLLVLSLLFHLMWDVAYGFFLQGFSTGLVVQLYRTGKEGLSIQAMEKGVRGDGEKDAILTWRLQNLLAGQYLSREGDHFYLLEKGRRLAGFTLFLKKLFKMDVTGQGS